MRIINAIICLMLLAASIQAQQTFVGVRAGATYMEMESLYGIERVSAGEYDTLNTYFTQDRQGIQGGFAARFSLDNKVYLQPEILLSIMQNAVAIDDASTTKRPDYIQYDDMLQLRIPVNAGLKLGFGKEKKVGIRAQAGLEAVFPISDTGTRSYYNIEGSFNNVFLNYQFGAGLDLGRIILDIYLQKRLVGAEWMPFDNRGTLGRAYFKSNGISIRMGFTFEG